MSNGVNPHNGNTPAQQATPQQIAANHFEGLEARTMMAGDPMAGNDSALAYDNVGNLHVAYYDANSKSLKYTMQSASTGTWSAPVTVDASSKDVGKQLTLAIGKNNKPGIAYRDADKQDLKYAFFDGKKWNVATVDAKKNTGVNPSLAYNKQGDALISFFRPSSNDLILATGGLKGWTFTTIATGNAAGRNSSVAADPKTGLPAVAFEGADGKVRYVEKTKQGDMAKPVVVESTSKGGGEVSLTFGPDKKPTFSYYDPETGEIKLATKNGKKGFGVETVATVEPGQDPNAKVIIDPTTGKAQVAFFDAANNGIFVANKDGEVTKVADGGSAGTPVVINPKTGKVVFTQVSEDGTPDVQDTTVIPAAPSDVTAETVSDSEILVSWSDNSDNEAGFLIERSLDDENWTAVTTVDANVTSYSDTGLTEGTAYVYRVTAVGPTGAKAVAEEFGDAATLPAAPSDVEVSSNSPNIVTVSWSDNSDGEEGYVVQRSTDGGATFTFLAERPAGVTNYTDNSVAEGTSYVYRVFATSEVGSSSAATSDAVTTELLAPSSLAAVSVSASQVNLAWTNNSGKATGAKIERSSDGGETWDEIGTVAGDASVFVDSTAQGGALYVYRVKATKNGNGSAHAHSSEARVHPSAPAISTTVVATTQVNLGWEPVNGAVSYVIERSADGGETFEQVGTTTQIAYSDDTVTEASAYVYRVRAVNAAGASANSNSANATTFLAAPSGLEASAVSPTQVNLSWTDNSNGETSFRVERSSDGGETWDIIGTAGANSTSYEDTTALEGRGYAYRVQGYKTIVQSDYTSTASTITPMVAPTNLVATAVSLTLINLTWDDNSAAETGYEIYRLSPGSDAYVLIATTLEGATGYNDDTVAEGSTYSYKIRAINSVTQSDMTEAQSVTTLPAAPTGLEGAVVSSTQIDLAWADNSNGESGYVVEVSTNGGDTWETLATLDAGTTSYSHTTATEGASYSYRITATNSAGNSEASNSVTAVTLTAAPTDLVATSTTATNVQLTWTDNSDTEVGYVVERSDDGGETFTAVSTLLSPGTELFNDDTAAAGTIYVYRVLAVNTATATAASESDTVLTLPAAATDVAAVATSPTAISLSWNAVAGASSYLVERTADGGTTWTTLASPSTNSYEDLAATEGGTFAYRVTSQNATGSGDVSAESDPVTTVPAAPTDLVATPVSAGQVDLAWTDNSDHETAYRVERSTDGGETWSTLATLADNTESYSDSSTSPASTYQYRVIAVGDAGDSDATGIETVLTVPAAPGNVEAEASADTRAVITWDAVTGASGYTIQRSDDNGVTFTTVALVGPDDLTYADTSASEATSYVYRVLADNATGSSVASATASVTTLPAAATNLTRTLVSPTQVDLAWEDNSGGETGYLVERSADGGTNFSALTVLGPGSTTYSDTAATEGTAYVYRVKPVNDTGTGEGVTVSATTAPVAPSALGLTPVSPTQVDLVWDDNSTHETGFVIERSLNGSDWTLVHTAAANATSWSDTTVAGGTEYYYRVRATGVGPDSANSNAPSALTAPAAVADLSLTVISTTQINVTWTDVAGEDGYSLERSDDGGATWTEIATPAANATSYNDTALSEGVTYTYRLTAANDTGSTSSNTPSATTLPAGADDLVATPVSAGQIDLAWDDNSAGETAFVIERSTDGGTTWTTVHTTAANVESWSDTTVDPATTYTYRVTAKQGAALSAASSTDAALTHPAAVTNLVADVVSDTQVDLTWDAVTGADTYLVEVSDDNGSTWTTLAAASASTSYSHATATEGTAYTYRVSATNATGDGASVTDTATTLAAAVTNVSATADSTTQTTLTWDDNSSGETGYRIEHSTDGGDTWATLHTTAAGVTTWAHTALTAGTTHSYRVIAENATGDSAASNTDSAITYPDVPTNLSATVLSDTEVDLAWDAVSSATGYLIEASDDNGTSWATVTTVGAVTTHSITNATEATSYLYRVSAVNGAGTGTASATEAATTLAAAPANVNATVNSATEIVVSWDDTSGGESAFRIERSDDGGTTWNEVHTTAADATFWTDSTLSAATTYKYRVIAENATGDSAVSNVATGLTHPDQQTGVETTVVSTTQVDLAWDAMPTATIYIIDYSDDNGSTWQQLTVLGNVQTYSHATATEGTAYLYRVYAVNSSGSGLASADASAKTYSAAASNVSVTAVDASQVDVAWDDNSSGESGYKVQRSDDNGATWTTVHTAAADEESWSDTTVAPGTTYQYRVVATNSTGDSAVSNTDSVLTHPDAVSDLTAIPMDATTVDLAWTPVASATGYLIEVSTDGGTTWGTLATVGNVATYSHTTATEADTFHYRVVAINATGNAAAGNEEAATTYPADPTGLTTTPTTATNIDLSWNDNSSGETGYVIERSHDGGLSFYQVHVNAADDTTWSDTTVTGGATFQYRVFAVNATGSSNADTDAAVLTIPGAVTNFTATAVSTTAINWTWDAVTGTVTGYRIENSTDAGTTWNTVTTINDPEAELFADTGLIEATDYLYRIVAFNATGDSAAASDTGTTYAAAASNLVATPQSTTDIDLAWDDNSAGETGFKIQRSADGGTTWTTIHTTAADVETWTDTTALAGTAYVYQVLAYNDAGNAAASNTDDALTLPDAATNLVVTPTSATSVTVSWDAVAGAATYTVRRSTDGGTTWTDVGSTATLTLDDTGRTEATLYTYDVVASNATGDAADSANEAVTTLPAAATTLIATADGTTGMDLTWSDNSAGETGYKIYRSDDNWASWSVVHTTAADVTTWSDSGLTEGTSYQYRIYAYNTSGNAAVSNTATANTAPEAVTGVTATADSATQVTVTWTDHSAGEDGFIIEASTDGGSTWTQVGTTAADVTTFAHTSATEGDTTEYRVRAYKGAVESADAATDSVTTVPAAASNLTATAIDHNTVDLAWDDNSASETDHDIYRSTDGGTSWTKIHTAAANAETWTDAAAPENVALQYKVVAVGSAGDSADSNVATATTPIATPTTLTATVSSNTTIDLAWSDNSSVETGYKVYRSADAGTTWTLIHTTAADATSYSDTTGVEDTTYTYKVVAADGTTNSADSNTDADKTKLDAPAITGVSSPTATSVTLNWNDNSDAETGYEIDRSDDGGTTWNTVHTTAADVTTWTNTGLTEATQYKFRVRAVNASNDSAYSAVSTLTTIPASASNVSVSPFSTTQIDITWDDNSASETGYVVERSTDGGTSWTDVHTAAADAESWSDTSLTEGADYQYRVRATGAGGNGIVSAADDTSTMPSAPTGLTSTVVNATQVDLAWTDNSNGETDYVIERSTDNGVSFSALTTVAAGSTSYSDTSALEATAYVYRVKAVRNAVSSDWSNSSVQVTTLPAGATDLAVTTPTNTRAVLTWTDNSSGETGFKVYRSADSGATWTLINTAAASATTYSDNTITEGGTYSYRVVAFNATGDAVASADVTVTSVPASPTGLSGSAANPSRIDLAWTDRSGAETGYKVERSLNGGSTWTQIDLLPANSNSYSDTTVTEGTNYQYRVRAYNTAGNSGYTNSVSVTTPLIAPTGLTATTVSATRVDLAWADNSAKEAQYKVERSADGGSTWSVIATTTANVTSYSDTSASEGTAYTYRVRASKTGNTSLYTSNVAATTLPAAPTGINASVASATQVNLSWSDNSTGEANYVVERSADGGTTWTQIATPAANATSYNDTTASEGTAYTYRVKAVNTGGSTAWSTSSQVTTLPAAPTDLVATSPYADTVELTWTDNSAHETGYKIERSDDNGSTWTQIGTASAGATSYADFTVEEGTEYQYRVRANISASNSAYSNTQTVTTVPLDPSDLVATTVSSTQIDLAWDDNSSGETGFKIERSDDGGITWTQIDTAAADATSYSDMTVTEGLPFQYRVRAYNAGGNSGYTSTAEAFALPAAPTGLSATAVAPDEIDLTWTDTSVGEEGFYLEREDSDTPGVWVLIDTLSPDSNSYADTTVASGKTYTYRLRAFNSAGDSANSATDSATTP